MTFEGLSFRFSGMHKSFVVPVLSCDTCNGELAATVSARAPLIQIKCQACGTGFDFEAASGRVRDKTQRKARHVAKRVSQTLLELNRTVPKSRDDLWRVVRDPRHPFTAALLTGVVLILMELSGFGIFMAVSWILGNLILNPVGWVLIPAIVAIALAYRRLFVQESFQRIRDQLTELQRRQDSGELSGEQLEQMREHILAQAFDAAALERILVRGDFQAKWIQRIRETTESEKPEWIWDSEHLPALQKALLDVKSHLHIYSGWLSVDVIAVIAEPLLAAMNRGVSIFIGYGWESPSGQQSRSQREVLGLGRLQAIAASSRGNGALVVRRFPNHSKLLVCDDKYVICGSANWLSNSGYHNREVSVRLYDTLLVRELLCEATDGFLEKK